MNFLLFAPVTNNHHQLLMIAEQSLRCDPFPASLLDFLAREGKGKGGDGPRVQRVWQLYIGRLKQGVYNLV